MLGVLRYWYESGFATTSDAYIDTHIVYVSPQVAGQVIRVPVAHGEGCYFADDATLHDLQLHDQILVRYCDEHGDINQASNPNGSCLNIAGIRNREGNVFGLMPHPERACDVLLGSTDGRVIFDSLLA